MTSHFNKIENNSLLLINRPIKIDIHNHPLIFCLTPDRAKFGKSWACNKCSSNYTYENASFYCTSCDFDICEKCLANYKLNEIEIINFNNNSMNSPNLNNNFNWQTNLPMHSHPLTLIKRICYNCLWKCKTCSNKYYKNDLSYYCSLCDYGICMNCYNSMHLPQPKAQILTAHQASNDNFQIQSFKFLNEEYVNNNLLYCPFPVKLLFTLLANGITPGNALDELKKGFSIQDLDSENNYYLNLLSVIRNYSSLNTINSFFSKFFPSNLFKSWLMKYGSTLSNSIGALNKFIEDNTHGIVKDYFNDSDASKDMILTNVLYFKGEWKDKFEPTPYPNQFYKSNNQVINNVQYMELKSTFKYYHDNSVEAIELLYKKDYMSALILLPNKSNSLDMIINGLTQDILNILYSKLSFTEVKLKMPKFKFEDSKKRIDLVKMINKLGVKEIFDFSTNNFIPLFKDYMEEHPPFAISDVFQTNLLDVDEYGTKLISITTIEGTFGCALRELPIEMIVNRPFLFVIRNKKNTFEFK